MPSLLFVCHANMCRSPMAAALFRRLVEQNRPGEEWRVASAGTWAFEGEPAVSQARQAMADWGIDLGGHRSQGVSEELVRPFDLILTMEQGQKEALQAAFPRIADRVYTLGEMAGSAVSVADPIGGTPADFAAAAGQIARLLEAGWERIAALCGGQASHTHDRRSVRVPGYDYSQAGVYFVTVCTQGRQHTLGDVSDGEVVLSPWGQIADEAWRWLAEQYPHVRLDEYIIMPNHLHGLLSIVDDDEPDNVWSCRGASRSAPTRNDPATSAPTRNDPAASSPTRDIPTNSARTGDTGGGAPTTDSPMAPRPKRKPLGRLIGAFKTVSTKRINHLRGTPGARFWQRNYFEHIVRDEGDLEAIREYIQGSPARWDIDPENPRRIPSPPPPFPWEV